MGSARMITDIEDFFTLGCGRCDRWQTPRCSALIWQQGVLALRRICLDMGLTEAVKWAHPCYQHAGRNICLIGALQGDFRLNFMNAALMKDPDGMLSRQGPNTQHPDAIMFRGVDEVLAKEAAIRSYIAEAMAYAEAGLLPVKETQVLDLPAELINAMDADPELAEAFQALTPGRQKSYVLHLNQAKAEATREARIIKCRDKILAGKGFNDY
jgi:uncharacterized protein YdeI (YjbR/CyaY-like superfamily)